MNKQHLKLGIAALIAIGICGWVIYGLVKPNAAPQYGDFAIDSAVTWLENADRGNFDVCRKNIVDHDSWFDWFIKDRKSLGKVKARSLSSRQELPGAAEEMKRYELKFNSKFGPAPKPNVSERIVVETDMKKQFKVLVTDYGRRVLKYKDITLQGRIILSPGQEKVNFSSESPETAEKPRDALLQSSKKMIIILDQLPSPKFYTATFVNTGVVEIFKFISQLANVKIKLSDRVIALNPKISIEMEKVSLLTTVKIISKAANLKFEVEDGAFFIEEKGSN